MRRFSSDGPVDTDLHYYTPRKALIEKGYTQLIGENPEAGSHYFTVWAPRQTGKSWIMQQILSRLQEYPRFHTIAVNLEILGNQKNTSDIIEWIAEEIGGKLGKPFKNINTQKKIREIFKKENLDDLVSTKRVKTCIPL